MNKSYTVSMHAYGAEWHLADMNAKDAKFLKSERSALRFPSFGAAHSVISTMRRRFPDKIRGWVLGASPSKLAPTKHMPEVGGMVPVWEQWEARQALARKGSKRYAGIRASIQTNPRAKNKGGRGSIPRGERAKQMLSFALKYPGWHSTAEKRSSDYARGMKAAKQLEKMGLIELTTADKYGSRQFRAVRSNPSAAAVNRADDLLNDFSGSRASKEIRAQVRPIRVGLAVGKLSGVMYEADRGDGMHTYLHRFKKSSRPLLVADHDGSQLGIVGGRYRFTELGIVDD